MPSAVALEACPMLGWKSSRLLGAVSHVTMGEAGVAIIATKFAANVRVGRPVTHSGGLRRVENGPDGVLIEDRVSRPGVQNRKGGWWGSEGLCQQGLPVLGPVGTLSQLHIDQPQLGQVQQAHAGETELPQSGQRRLVSGLIESV